MQNGFVESFNGRMKDELLNETLFHGLRHARSALGYQTPAAFAANLNTATGQSVVPTAPDGVSHKRTQAAAG